VSHSTLKKNLRSLGKSARSVLTAQKKIFLSRGINIFLSRGIKIFLSRGINIFLSRGIKIFLSRGINIFFVRLKYFLSRVSSVGRKW
jgi:hypothetical protein